MIESMRRPMVWLAAACLAGTALCRGETGGASPSPSEERKVAGGLTIQGSQAGWRGLYPGRSTTADVTRVLGHAARTEPSGGLTRMIYPPDADLKFNSVYVDASGIVKTIGWANFEDAWRIPTKELWSALGEPKMVSKWSFVKQGSIYQWEAAAVWGVVDKNENTVFSLIFHDPKEPPQIPVPEGPPRQ